MKTNWRYYLIMILLATPNIVFGVMFNHWWNWIAAGFILGLMADIAMRDFMGGK